MEGDLIENIKSVAEDKIDFVVMGTAGVTDWDAVLWDLTLGMSLLIAVPVLCIPWEPNTTRLKR
jgi:hypothetical protein